MIHVADLVRGILKLLSWLINVVVRATDTKNWVDSGEKLLLGNFLNHHSIINTWMENSMISLYNYNNGNDSCNELIADIQDVRQRNENENLVFEHLGFRVLKVFHDRLNIIIYIFNKEVIGLFIFESVYFGTIELFILAWESIS